MTTVLPKNYGPAFRAPNPRQIVIHSAECDHKSGIALSLARGWWQNPANKTSAHGMADPSGSVDMVPLSQRAWHCGNGNATSLGEEISGRAAWTRAQWLANNGEQALRNASKQVATWCKEKSIRPRWLSLTQLANNEDGLCTHNDMRLVRGGTTHTDPGAGFPYDLFLQFVKEYMGVAPKPPKPAPAPTMMEWIMSLPGAPANLTYKQLIADIAQGVLDAKITITDSRLRPDKSRATDVRGAINLIATWSSSAEGGAVMAGRIFGYDPEDRQAFEDAAKAGKTAERSK